MKTRIIFAALAGSLLLLPACPTKKPVAGRKPRPTRRRANPSQERHVFYVYAKGRRATMLQTPPEAGYVFHTWSAERTRGHAVLREGFGMMVFYQCWLPNPVPRFVLFAHDDGEIIQTTSLDEFRQEVSRIPAGETLRCFNTCAGGTHSGLDPSILEGMEAFCRQRGIVFLNGGHENICVCA